MQMKLVTLDWLRSNPGIMFGWEFDLGYGEIFSKNVWLKTINSEYYSYPGAIAGLLLYKDSTLKNNNVVLFVKNKDYYQYTCKLKKIL